jgi:putative ABC transport system permease protein
MFLNFPASIRRLMLRSLIRRPLQSILFVAGVALGVAMMVAIDVANTSASRAFGIFTESLTGRTTHQVLAGSTGVPEALYRAIRVDLGIRESAPTVTGYVQALELNAQPMRIFGIDPFAEAPFRNYLALGSPQANAQVGDTTALFTEPNTVMMAADVADRYGLKLGDTFTAQFGVAQHTLKIVGLLRAEDGLTAEGLQDMLITDISTAQEVLGLTGRLSTIDLIIPQTPAGEATLSRIQNSLPEGVLIQEAGARNSAVGQMSAAFNLSLTALSLLALVVGMFLIYNTVTFSIVQRRPIFGILRALGVTRREVFGMVLAESALLGLIGTLIGLMAGVLMGRLAVLVVTQTLSSLYFTVSVRGVDVPLISMAKGFAVGFGAAILAAILPALEATSTPPVGTLKRSDIEGKMRKLVPAISVLGVLMTAGALLLLQSPALELSFAGLFGIVVGCSLLTPLVTLVVMRLVHPLTARLFGVLGLMAPRSISRALSRTSIAIAALMVAVSVIVGISAMVGSFRTDVQNWLQGSIQADILIVPPSISAIRQEAPLDPGIRQEILEIPGIASVAASRTVDVVRIGDPLPVLLSAIDEDISRGGRRYVWQIGPFSEIVAAMKNGAVVISETLANQRGIAIGPGQNIRLLTEKGEQAFPIAAVMVDFSGDQGVMLMDITIYHQYYSDRMISVAAAFVEPGADVRAIIQALQAKFAGRYALSISSNSELRQGALAVFDQTFAITTALNLLATVVAFIGILSALAALQLERTRELGTMRANGMTRRQMFRMTLLETGLMGGVAGLMALPVGTLLAYILVYIINVRSFGWSLRLSLQPEFYTQAVLVALIAALLAGVYPALRIGRILPAQALRAE